MCVLQKIKTNKQTLFGQFSLMLSKESKVKAWQEIGAYAKSIGVIPDGKQLTYIRDAWWPNVRKLSVEKRDNARTTGTGGGPLSKVTEIDDVVYDILGKDSPTLEGIGVPESMNTAGEEIYFCEQVGQEIPQVAEVIVSECTVIEDNLLAAIVTPYHEKYQGTEKQTSLKTQTLKFYKRSVSQETETKNTDMLKRKLELTVEVMEKEIHLKSLQIANIERDNYLKDLKILHYEVEHGLHKSKYTEHLRTISQGPKFVVIDNSSVTHNLANYNGDNSVVFLQ